MQLRKETRLHNGLDARAVVWGGVVFVFGFDFSVSEV